MNCCLQRTTGREVRNKSCLIFAVIRDASSGSGVLYDGLKEERYVSSTRYLQDHCLPHRHLRN